MTGQTITSLFPQAGPNEVGALLDEVRGGDGLRYGDDEVIEFLSTLSRSLLRAPASRSRPEIVALGYFLRRSALAAIQGAHPRVDGSHRRAPAGLVFHVPPTNVDTMFVYSWALSMLCGNRNIVRISPRAGAATLSLIAALGDTLASGSFSRVATTQRVVQYGHEDAVNAAFSAACDLRVIWGGDDSVSSIRRYALAPAARDITFPNRSSFSVIETGAFMALGDEERHELAAMLFNDMYWFDQAGCSSPRWLAWVGGSEAEMEISSASLATHLRAVVTEKRFQIETGAVIDKMVNAYGAIISGVADRFDLVTNELVLVRCPTAGQLPRAYAGVGFLYEAHVDALEQLVDVVTRADQTVGHFGFEAEQLGAFADRCNGRGIDRIVPIGEALSFSEVWDGMDLLDQMTRRVEVRVRQGGRPGPRHGRISE